MRYLMRTDKGDGQGGSADRFTAVASFLDNVDLEQTVAQLNEPEKAKGCWTEWWWFEAKMSHHVAKFYYTVGDYLKDLSCPLYSDPTPTSKEILERKWEVMKSLHDLFENDL